MYTLDLREVKKHDSGSVKLHGPAGGPSHVAGLARSALMLQRPAAARTPAL